MKTLAIKMTFGCLLFASVATQSFGQAPMTSIEDGGKMPNKLEKSSVPKPITEMYIMEYPTTTNESWYGYPSFANETDWYGYDSYLYTSNNPEYYIVEFVNEDNPHKVIYAKNGKKIATHHTFKTEVPKAISLALSKGEYKAWTIMKEKEEMFRHADKMKVYKVVVEKGMEKHALYFEANGKLLKDKKLKS